MFTLRMFRIAPVLLATVAPCRVGAQSKHQTSAAGVAAHMTVKPARADYAMVNGLRMYYEIYGTKSAATPLVLLHGGGSTIGTNFSRIIPLLQTSREVIAVEFQAHGHTRDIDRPFTFEGSADDVFALLNQLHIPKADLLGFSNGGTTALQVAIRHPEVVNRLVIASANYRRDGMAPWFWDFMKKGTFADMPQPYKDAYLKIVPSEEGLHAMHDRDNQRMLAFKDIPDEAIHAIQAPALVVVGDSDVIQPEHALQLSRLLPHGRLCILPGTHGSYMGEIMTPNADPRAFVLLVIQHLSPAGS
jgi:pimeloyl-ACP methyl ester carboxylesterase